MKYYTIALFFHIVGALGVFIALGVEWTTIYRLRQATTTVQAREWLRVASGTRWLGSAAMALILVAGLFMMAVAQIGAAWLIVAFWLFVALIVLALALTGPRVAAVRRAVAAEPEQAAISPALYRVAHHPLLWLSIQVRVAIALGIVFLMTIKPDLSGALLTVGIAVVLGLAAALPLRSHARPQEKPAL